MLSIYFNCQDVDSEEDDTVHVIAENEKVVGEWTVHKSVFLWMARLTKINN